MAKHDKDSEREPDKLPGDDSNRVVLSEGARRELGQLEREELARLVASSAKEVGASASSMSRIVRGLSKPPLRIARRLAAALRKDPAEVIAEYAPQYQQPTHRWGARAMFATSFRKRVMDLLGYFSPFIDAYVYFDFPRDPERPERAVIEPARAEFEYQYFEIAIPPREQRGSSMDFIVSLRIMHAPALFFDYGRIEIIGDEAIAYEFVMRRYHTHALRPEAKSLWVKVWNDGRLLPHLIRSSSHIAFGRLPLAERVEGQGTVRVTRMVTEPTIQDHDCVVPFPAGGSHMRAPFTKTVEIF